MPLEKEKISLPEGQGKSTGYTTSRGKAPGKQSNSIRNSSLWIKDCQQCWCFPPRGQWWWNTTALSKASKDDRPNDDDHLYLVILYKPGLVVFRLVLQPKRRNGFFYLAVTLCTASTGKKRRKNKLKPPSTYKTSCHWVNQAPKKMRSTALSKFTYWLSNQFSDSLKRLSFLRAVAIPVNRNQAATAPKDTACITLKVLFKSCHFWSPPPSSKAQTAQMNKTYWVWECWILPTQCCCCWINRSLAWASLSIEKHTRGAVRDSTVPLRISHPYSNTHWPWNF